MKWDIRKLDVKNSFLHGYINEDIYMEQPLGMPDRKFSSHVFKLQKAIYGLKHALRAWFDHSRAFFFLKQGFFCSLADSSLFILHSSHGTLVLLLYVDDMLLIDFDSKLPTEFITIFHSEFPMKDLRPIHHFLGIEVQQYTNTLHLSQTHYAKTILDKAQMLDCKPMNTLMESTPLCDPTFYRSIVGALQYLTLTRLDLSFRVNYVSQFMQTPTIACIKTV